MIHGKQKKLGCFDTSEEAFNKHKEVKEEYIKQVANEYYGLIPTNLFEAMYNWEVEITD